MQPVLRTLATDGRLPGHVVMESREQLMARIRREVAEAWTGSADTSAADELIADRRAESAAADEQP